MFYNFVKELCSGRFPGSARSSGRSSLKMRMNIFNRIVYRDSVPTSRRPQFHCQDQSANAVQANKHVYCTDNEKHKNTLHRQRRVYNVKPGRT